MINKTQTKKLCKALELQGTDTTSLYIGKSSIGMWYVGDEKMGAVSGAYNNYITPELAINAVLGGFRPEEALRVIRDQVSEKE